MVPVTLNPQDSTEDMSKAWQNQKNKNLVYTVDTVHRDTIISGDSMSSLLYTIPVYGLCTMYIHGAETATSGASGVKIWHPPRKAGRKGVRGGEEEGWSGV
jgi:hypothetical protein